MNKKLLAVIAAGLGLLLASGARGETGSESRRCGMVERWLAAGGSYPRQYAADREVQVLHLALDVTPDFPQHTIAARATLRFKPILKPVQELKLDAIDLRVGAVEATETIQAYQVTREQIIVTFAQPIAPGKETDVTVVYTAEPRDGLYFRTPEMGYKEGDAHLFSQGEAIAGRRWYPCLDTPNQQFSSEIRCGVPDGMTVISNGRLVSEQQDPATGLRVFHWSQEKPHANYLISLVAGHFKKLEDTCNGTPLAFFTPPSEFPQAAASFRNTKDIMAFFEREIGMRYPWDKYYQVCVNDFVAGGMENTSATTLTDGTLFTEATENLEDSDGLVAHEMAHQWFGDLVTCRDWSHLWINEGFATYYETLYDEHKNGRDSLLYSLYQRARQITSVAGDTQAIVRRDFDHPDQMFGYLVYPKAGWVLHMLRSQLGVDLYRRCVKTFLERHQFGTAVTEDFRSIVEELSGRSFDQFFDQWLYHGRQPELEISYSWDELTKLARISVRQSQEVNQNVLLFSFPLTIRFKCGAENVDREIRVSRKEEEFRFPLPSAPQAVRVDPEYTLLAAVRFNLPGPMVEAQLADKADVIGRLLAVEHLSRKRDQGAIAKLKQALNEDPFYGVRLEASQALRSIHTEDALAALVESAKQSDARVRRQVVEDIGGFYSPAALSAAQRTIESERNPAIVSVALQGLGGYPDADVRPVLLKFLGANSYRNQLADAAIRAMRLQDDPGFVTPLLETLDKREAEFTSHGFAQGIETLAYLARNEEKKDVVRDYLLDQLNDKRHMVVVAAIHALGALGDPRAIAALERFTTAGRESGERSAAEAAVTALRAGRKPVDDFKNLRQEVLDLQKASRDLRKELDDLKQKCDTAIKPVSAPAAPAPKPKVRSPKGSL